MSNDSIALINTRLQPGAWPSPSVSRFNGLLAPDKPLKRFLPSWPVNTGLKPGANEIVVLDANAH
ncbi:MAG TPA: hypothetical protein VGI03_00445 [Verrucomicrobiae bacterium]